ncbi:MAG TPA: hypothetical protein VFL67_00730, partial [Mycobacterium sp.]|nr:hypothetical protein [Mycobacterium sp.]
MNDARAAWQPPPEPMLSSSMRERPTVGWRTNVVDVGLPESSASRIAVSNDPFGPRPLVGSRGDNAYLLASSAAPAGQQWWLVGLDVRDGDRIFNAVPLGVTLRPPQCFLNGPTDVLCLDQLPSSSAWVIDGLSGSVQYAGPTKLRLGFDTLAVKQIGIHAVAETQDQGVYGIGPRAETTWFVPGDGRAQTPPPGAYSPVSQSLAAQYGTNPRKLDTTVFSVSDGVVIKPGVEAGTELAKTAVYPGGFASEIYTPDGRPSGISFFDETGKRVGDQNVEGALTDDLVDLPIISQGEDKSQAVYSPQGRRIFDAPWGASELVGNT